MSNDTSGVVPPKAIEWEQEAKRAAPSPLETEAWLKLAKQWREMGERMEKYSC